MTREQFLNGASFKVKGSTYKGDWTYRYEGEVILRESRSSVDERVLTYSHHCNVSSVGRVGFKGFAYIFNKLINSSYRFEDLVEFKEEV